MGAGYVRIALVESEAKTKDALNRIREAMEKDPDFPRFEELNFPAKNRDPESGTWDGTFLFSTRFPDTWYKGQYAAQGSFAPALLDCEPVMEGGNLFDTAQIVFHDDPTDFPNAIREPDGSWSFPGYRRGWDLASSEKQRAKDDPDYTVGVLGYVKEHRTNVRNAELRAYEIWIADVVSNRKEAPDRDRMILQTVVRDGRRTSHHIERFGAYKDAYTTLKKLLFGVVVVSGSTLPGDKVAKAAVLEGPFLAGRIHVLRAPWTDFWLKHFNEFPDGKHDDAVDATVVMFDGWVKQRGGIAAPGFQR